MSETKYNLSSVRAHKAGASARASGKGIDHSWAASEHHEAAAHAVKASRYSDAAAHKSSAQMHERAAKAADGVKPKQTHAAAHHPAKGVDGKHAAHPKAQAQGHSSLQARYDSRAAKATAASAAARSPASHRNAADAHAHAAKLARKGDAAQHAGQTKQHVSGMVHALRQRAAAATMSGPKGGQFTMGPGGKKVYLHKGGA